MKSLLGKKWLIKNEDNLDFFSYFLKSRKVECKETFLNQNYPEGLFNENLLPDIEKGVNRVIEAIEKKERIVIFGDYDCDGIPATAICTEVLKNLGAEISYRIPDREEDGYGLKNYFLDELKEKNVKLIITVDNGIASLNEVDYANSFGIDTIITDHHEIQDGKIPNAIAVINPQREDCVYPFKEIAGATVAWKFMIAIAKKIKGEDFANNQVRDKYIELVALSTVADVMPLISENRIIVKKGLIKIKETKNKGLLAILKEMGFDFKNEITSDFFGFQLGPRINATGRLSHGHFGVQLLLGNESHAPYIENLNKERKEIINFALEKLENFKPENKQKIILKDEKWKAGIIGLIAGKIQEKFNLPVVICQEKEGKIAASCRAPVGFNIFDFLSNFKEFFINFGGHAQACGFSMDIEKFDEFKEKAENLSIKILEDIDLENILEIDYELDKDDLTIDFIKEVKKFEPFGHGNKSPVFFLKNIKTEVFTFGKENEHLSLNIFGKKAVSFSLGKEIEKIKKAEFFDLAFVLSIKKWNGEEQLSIQVIDFFLY